jgi:hypothetical protein
VQPPPLQQTTVIGGARRTIQSTISQLSGTSTEDAAGAAAVLSAAGWGPVAKGEVSKRGQFLRRGCE